MRPGLHGETLGAADQHILIRGGTGGVGAFLTHVPEWMYAAVRQGGQLIVPQEPPNEELVEKYGISAVFFVVGTRRDGLEELATLLDAGDVDVAIAQTFPLSAGRGAYESGHRPKPRPGKTVILVP